MTPAENLPPVSTTPAANFATSFTSIVDFGGNTLVNNTGGKFVASNNDTGGKFATGVKQWEQYQAAETLKLT